MEKRQNTFRCVRIYSRPFSIGHYYTYNHPWFVSSTKTSLNTQWVALSWVTRHYVVMKPWKSARRGERSMMSALWDPLLRFSFWQVRKSSSSFQPGQRCTWKCLHHMCRAARDWTADGLKRGQRAWGGGRTGQHFTFTFYCDMFYSLLLCPSSSTSLPLVNLFTNAFIFTFLSRETGLL